MLSQPYRKLFWLWLAWVFILPAFQAWSAMRFQVKHPDFALEWTSSETTLTYKNTRPYLHDPFMNQQVAFDSEYYLSIATVGYEDTNVPSGEIMGKPVPLNYAFMPLYPYVMKAVALPLRLLQLTPIATSTLAGVIVSMLGTLGGMLALYDLALQEVDEDGGLRAAFYLLIFPAGVFLGMVYTEGLFVGLAFGSLALLGRKKWGWAALLAVCATWTRTIGVALIIPFTVEWIRSGAVKQVNLTRAGLKSLARGGWVLAPLVAYLVWRLSPLGQMFTLVEESYFGRGLFNLEPAISGWVNAVKSISGTNTQAAAYYLVEIGSILLGLVACAFTMRRNPGISLFSLAVIVISLTSGYPQGMVRYVMTAPAVYLFLSRLGKNQSFSHAWTLISTLLMAALAVLFAADMWVG